MRTLLVLSAALAMGCVGGSSQSQTSNCKKSGDCIQLTHAQLSCIAMRIDRLLTRITDPVYFDAAQCDQSPMKMSSGSVVIHIPEADRTPKANWIQLSKAQLKCLRSLLPSLQANVDDPVSIEAGSLGCS
jgi:hypothetical protein